MKMKYPFKNKNKGTTLLSVIICLAVGTVLISCSISILVPLYMNIRSETDSQHRIYKLYSTIETIEDYLEGASVKDVKVDEDKIEFKYNNVSSSIYLDNLGIVCFNNQNSNERFNCNEAMVDERVSKLHFCQKGNMIYIMIEMEKGEHLKGCAVLGEKNPNKKE